METYLVLWKFSNTRPRSVRITCQHHQARWGRLMMHHYTWSLPEPTLLLLLTEYLCWTNSKGAGMWGKKKRIKSSMGCFHPALCDYWTVLDQSLRVLLPASDLLLELARLIGARVQRNERRVKRNLWSMTPKLKTMKEKIHRNVSISYIKLKGRWQTMK